MSLWERVAFSLLTGIFFLLFFSATRINFYRMDLDAALMAELVDTTFERHIPGTRLGKSIIAALDRTISKPAEVVCSMPLTPESPGFLNEFERHSHLVLYLTVPFRLLLGSKPIVFFLNSFAFVGFLAIAYWSLRTLGVSIWPSLAVLFLVSAHPAWSYSAFGQPYIDRLFLPLGLLYLILLYDRLKNDKYRSAAIIGVSLLATLVSERTSLMLGACTIAALVLYRGWRGWRRSDFLLLGIAAAAISYPLVYMAAIQSNPDYTTFRGSIGAFLSSTRNPVFAGMVGKFLLINIGLFGSLAFFEWRLGLIALGVMLPNILGTIGGAEKTGWSTHYHSVYFPFLVAAVLVGVSNVWEKFKDKRVRHALILVPATLGLILLFLDPYSGIWDSKFAWANMRSYAVRRTIEIQAASGPGLSVIMESKFTRGVAASIPPGVEVTTNEGMIPALYGNHVIHFYPLGLGTSEYAALPYDRQPDGSLRFFGAVSYLGPAEERKLNDCLGDRLRAGYKVATIHPYSGSYGYAVLQRER